MRRAIRTDKSIRRMEDRDQAALARVFGKIARRYQRLQRKLRKAQEGYATVLGEMADLMENEHEAIRELVVTRSIAKLTGAQERALDQMEDVMEHCEAMQDLIDDGDTRSGGEEVLNPESLDRLAGLLAKAIG
jgi:predicted  nucleic acid-binding Zn-ribbon protein